MKITKSRLKLLIKEMAHKGHLGHLDLDSESGLSTIQQQFIGKGKRSDLSDEEDLDLKRQSRAAKSYSTGAKFLKSAQIAYKSTPLNIWTLSFSGTLKDTKINDIIFKHYEDMKKSMGFKKDDSDFKERSKFNKAMGFSASSYPREDELEHYYRLSGRQRIFNIKHKGLDILKDLAPDIDFSQVKDDDTVIVYSSNVVGRRGGEVFKVSPHMLLHTILDVGGNSNYTEYLNSISPTYLYLYNQALDTVKRDYLEYSPFSFSYEKNPIFLGKISKEELFDILPMKSARRARSVIGQRKKLTEPIEKDAEARKKEILAKRKEQEYPNKVLGYKLSEVIFKKMNEVRKSDMDSLYYKGDRDSHFKEFVNQAIFGNRFFYSKYKNEFYHIPINDYFFMANAALDDILSKDYFDMPMIKRGAYFTSPGLEKAIKTVLDRIDEEEDIIQGKYKKDPEIEKIGDDQVLMFSDEYLTEVLAELLVREIIEPEGVKINWDKVSSKDYSKWEILIRNIKRAASQFNENLKGKILILESS